MEIRRVYRNGNRLALPLPTTYATATRMQQQTYVTVKLTADGGVVYHLLEVPPDGTVPRTRRAARRD